MQPEIEEQHPIPQDISAYQFRLVGDMTLKQFLQLAGGVIIAMLLYASSLNPYIKWPLMVLSFALGAAMAFLPIEDRPFGTWIIIFFKSIYSPTIYVYKKPANPVSWFAPEGTIPPTELAPQPQVVKVQETVVEEEPEKLTGTVFVSEAEAEVLDKLEKKERNLLSKFTTLFSSPLTKPKPVHSEGSGLQQTPNTGGVKLPEPITISIDEKTGEEKVEVPEKTPEDELQEFVRPVAPFVKPFNKFSSMEATFSELAAPPMPPTLPNVIVGQVLDSEGKILEGAILEIKDEEGRAVRALRSNRLGHFMIVTPLANGRYQLVTEKEGFEFNVIHFEARGEIIEPIEIKALENKSEVQLPLDNQSPAENSSKMENQSSKIQSIYPEVKPNQQS